MTSKDRKNGMKVLIVAVIMQVLVTIACVTSGGGGPCDLTGPDTAVTTCIAGELSK